MAPIKRKSESVDGSKARVLNTKLGLDSSRSQPFKKQKRDQSTDHARAKSQNDTTAKAQIAGVINPRAKPISVLREEEPSFPRGGASVLTPLEYKQIKADATRDVLFEQNSSKDARHNSDGEISGVEQKPTAAPRQKKGAKSRTNNPQPESAVEEKHVKIQGLSYKRIVPGSIILGQVSKIHANDIALALPNNLTGYIPLTAVSSKLTERLEALVKNESDNEDISHGEGKQQDRTEPRDFFHHGQYLRAYVVSTSEESTINRITKNKKHIELSVNPQQANSGLTPSDLIEHSMVQASVISIEDHGLVMDLGLTDATIKGFMSSKEVGKNVDYGSIQEGAVFLCRVTGQNSSGQIVKLSADMEKAGNVKKSNFLTEAPTIDAFLPGTAVEILVDEVTSSGIAGKIMGMLDVTADVVHSGATSKKRNLEKLFKIGTKTKCRIICTFPSSETKRLGVSLLDHVLSLSTASIPRRDEKNDPTQVLPISSIIQQAKVVKVEPGMGLFLDLGVKDVLGFVHISRISDTKVESITESIGPYKLESLHRARIVGFNPMDGLYIVSMEQKIINEPFLRIEDIKVGEVVKGTIERLVVNAAGLGGALVNLAEGITGLVPEMHLADVKLSHPERKFKEGMTVTGRILSTDPEKKQFRLTLKKSLVNSETAIFNSYDEILAGAQSPGTLVNILSSGAVVQFYSDLRAFLPVSEMSEAYIKDPSQHFRKGQVVNVHVLSVDPARRRMIVSCRDPDAFGPEQKHALDDLTVGDIVTGQVTEKSDDDITVQLDESDLKAHLPVGHLTDGSEKRGRSTLKSIRVGQTLNDMVVLEKDANRRLIVLSNKSSLVDAARSNNLISKFEDVTEGKVVDGFVKRIIPSGVIIQFASGLTGLLLKRLLPDAVALLPDFGTKQYRSISATVSSVDHVLHRFLLSQKDNHQKNIQGERSYDGSDNHDVINPCDGESLSINNFTLGKLTKARVSSVKGTQVNVHLADNLQGRIDVSAVFDSWADIKDRKRPLQIFKARQIIPVRILGIHDARNHRFLPITHRTGRVPVFELSAKPSDQTSTDLDILTLDKVKIGTSWCAFINNIAETCVWVNLSPNVRGRLRHMDLSDDVSLLTDIESHFPIGSALRVHVTGVDLTANRLDLSARSAQPPGPLTYESLCEGMVIPGRVTKVTERLVMVQLSDLISGPVFLTDLEDDYDRANPTNYSKNEIVRVCVTKLDVPNKRVSLSSRASKVLNSALPVRDREISSISQLKINDIVRGFVKNVADSGVFITLGRDVTAYVRVSDLSDSYIKDFKSAFQVDQLVKGKIIAVDAILNHVQLSLKNSIVDKDYIPPITFNDLAVGQIITGKVRKVEDFGVFIVVDGSSNVSGLCHRSEVADQRFDDVRKLYDEGDVVKAKILRIDPEKRRVSFGLKASYFEDVSDSGEASSEDSDAMEGIILQDGVKEDDEDDETEGGVNLESVRDYESVSADEVSSSIQSDSLEDPIPYLDSAGLTTTGFDWTGNILDREKQQPESDSSTSSSENNQLPRKKRHHKPTIKPADLTGTLDATGPQSVSDFERLLLSQPSSSYLWLSYMAFQIQLSEIDKAREIASRALRTIDITEQVEKLNVWIAWLNLENTFGSQESIENIYHRACKVCDPKEIGEKLISIYIQSGKNDQASALYDSLLSKPPTSPALWHNYLSFLMHTARDPSKARTTLARALQSLPPHNHIQITSQFACLEFRAEAGDPERGRTIFEGLLDTWPKRWDLWGVWLDMEIVAADAAAKVSVATQEGKPGNKKTRKHRDDQQDMQEDEVTAAHEHVRALFNRILRIKQLKPRKASKFFKRWIAWEESVGGIAGTKSGADEKETKKRVDMVKAKAAEFVRSHAGSRDGGGSAES
ncbi:MAG: rRNA biogenesis protein rrp5 [Sclerophora amabilis]|nr:MAG: rRNA biogenesis protein rrp5 [Sclerophora amabilis]